MRLEPMRVQSTITALILAILTGFTPKNALSEVVLQWFETDWSEMRYRLPEVAEMGYHYVWIPPPTKSPVAGTIKWSNLGYSLYDRFDIGQYPQRGTWATRFGTKGELQQLTQDLHACGLGLLPDVVMNHNGSGPDFRTYPGMKANDFHVWEDLERVAGWKRAPRMTHYDDIQDGYGKTFTEELAGLIDIVTEPDDRFTAHPPYFAVEPLPFIRHPGQPELYPNIDTTRIALPKENVREMLNRWIYWLGTEIHYDGLRIDAAKHTVADFYYNQTQSGFLQSAASAFEAFQKPSSTGKPPLFMAEILSDTDQLAYFQKNVPGMRYLDQPYRLHVLTPAFEEGKLSAITNYTKALSPDQGIRFIQSHDDGGPANWQAATLTTLTLPGDACIYTTAHNLAPDEHDTKTWVRPGRDAAVHAQDPFYQNILYLHNHFARGSIHFLHTNDDLVIFERYEDLNKNNQPDQGEALLLVIISQTSDIPDQLLHTHFATNQQLHSYLQADHPTDIRSSQQGHVPTPLIQLNEFGLAAVAPKTVTPRIRFSTPDGGPCPQLDWPIPSGRLGKADIHPVPLITNKDIAIEVEIEDLEAERVAEVYVHFQSATRTPATLIKPGLWTATLDTTDLRQGLNLLQLQATLKSPQTTPTVFHTQTKSFYLDTRPPELTLLKADSSPQHGDRMIHVLNNDHTAAEVFIGLNAADPIAMHSHQHGEWFASLSDIPPGNHLVEILARRDRPGAKTAPPLEVIHQVPITAVSLPSHVLDLNLTEQQQITEPFFPITVKCDLPLTEAQLRLSWNGFTLARWTNVTEKYEHIFDGRYLAPDGSPHRFFGAFCNGPHYIEVTYTTPTEVKKLTRVVHFNLYGSNEVDSDGDGLPDDVEFPDFTRGAPGPKAERWPGDFNRDMVPDPDEHWTHLNPMNHNTIYSGIWDGDLDWDGDGFPNLCEVRMGYREHTNAYVYNIYDPNSHPTTCPNDTLRKNHTLYPPILKACPGTHAQLTFHPSKTGLANATVIQVGYAFDQWQQPLWTNMTPTAWGAFTCGIPLREDVGSLHYLFTDPAGTHKIDQAGVPYSVHINRCIIRTNYFKMDGLLDPNVSAITLTGLPLYAKRTNNNLYVATSSAHGAANDHFLFISPIVTTNLTPAPWAKQGLISFDLAHHPHLTAESGPADSYFGLHNGGIFGQVAMGSAGEVLEAEIILDELFDPVPENLYLLAVGYADEDGKPPVIQSGSTNIPDATITSAEFFTWPSTKPPSGQSPR